MLTFHVWCDRYGAVADKEGTFCLYTTHIPVVRSKRPDPCCIVRWNTQDNVSVTKMLNTGSELLSALAVRYACNDFQLIHISDLLQGCNFKGGNRYRGQCQTCCQSQSMFSVIWHMQELKEVEPMPCQ